MNVRYWFPPGTDAMISHNGGPFEPFTSGEAMIFRQPVAESSDEFTFDGFCFQVRVAKALVYRCEWDGNGGHNRLCG